MKAYHFLKDDMRGGYGGGKKWKIGEEREHKGELVMCSQGYHAGKSWYDALSYARGNMACLVELSGRIIKDTDKYVAQKRKLVDAKNAEYILRAWGCDCAERALKKSKVTDERLWDAIKVARLSNDGRATKVELAARAAARAAAWDARAAARDAAWAAAWDTAWAAARAARAAARAAAWDARAAARAAAWDARAAARDAAGDARAAARDARAAARDARAAAGDAEIKWQRRRLNWYMKKLFGEGNDKV